MMSAKLKRFLEEIRLESGNVLPRDLHITRKSCALVAISGGKVIKIGKPQVHHCPLFTTLFSHKSLDPDTIQDKFEKQIDSWGMFTCRRHICDDKIIVPFGASEMIMYALKRGNIDAAVTVCEGAGTVITSNPAVVQGIGAYMNGIFYTSPIPDVIADIKKNGGFVLSEKNAEMNQLKGVRRAFELGYTRVAVTVRGDEKQMIAGIRSLQKETRSSMRQITILAICNTGITQAQAQNISKNADLAWACASKEIRRIVGPHSILQIGMKIPVFVLTLQGIDFISAYLSDPLLKDTLRDVGQKHYITSSRFAPGSIKINMGRFSVYLYETGKLPVVAEDEPGPLI